jgi:uncharacterized protein (DUF362 family)
MDPRAQHALQPADSRSRVSLARLTSYAPAAVAEAVSAVLAPLGGMGAFVRPGMRVVLKPNLLLPSAPERAICTHPEILRAVARLAHRSICPPRPWPLCPVAPARLSP